MAVCSVGPCTAEQAPGSPFCPTHGPSRESTLNVATTGKPKPQPVSACPRCGGTSFVPRRKMATKVAFGFASLLGRPKHTECASCGLMFRRPN